MFALQEVDEVNRTETIGFFLSIYFYFFLVKRSLPFWDPTLQNGKAPRRNRSVVVQAGREQTSSSVSVLNGKNTRCVLRCLLILCLRSFAVSFLSLFHLVPCRLWVYIATSTYFGHPHQPNYCAPETRPLLFR